MSKGAILQNTKYIRTFAAMIKENIQRVLRQTGRTQRDLCRDLGITPQSMQYYFKGNITIAKLSEIAQAIGVQPWELLREPGTQDGSAQAATTQEQPRPTETNNPEPGPRCPYCGKPLKICRADDNQEKE